MADALADDVVVLDLTTLTWSALPPQSPPMPQLCRHAMAATGTVAMAGPPDTAAASAAAAVTAIPPPTSPSPAEATIPEPTADACQPSSCAVKEEAPVETGTSPEAEALPSTKVEHSAADETAVWVFGGFDGSNTRGELIRLQLPAALAAHHNSDASSEKVCTFTQDRL